MASLAEEYVFARLAMLDKEHDEHLKAASVNVYKEVDNTDGVEFKKEPVTAVRYITCGSWVLENEDYGLGSIDNLREVLELDDEKLYEWATKEYGHDYHAVMPINRQEVEFAYQIIDTRAMQKQVFAAEKNSVGYFNCISDEPCSGCYCFLEHDEGAKKKAIADIRYSIKCAIENLERGTDEEEEDSDE